MALERTRNAGSTHNANLAAFLTWVVPGSGQFYLGRPLAGAIGFVVVTGLYWLGYKLSNGMTFEFLDPELRSRFATALTPELGNLGALTLQMMRDPYGAAYPGPRPWPPGIMTGSLLTALSGIVNAFFMAQAHMDARAPRPIPAPGAPGAPGDGADAQRRLIPPALAAAASWCVPGLGQLLQGRKLRAGIIFVLLVGLFATGTWLAGGTNLSRERHFYFWTGQFLLGGPAIVVEMLSGRPMKTADTELFHEDAGLTFACIAGLLGVLAMLDAFAWSEALWLGRDPLVRGTHAESAAEELPA